MKNRLVTTLTLVIALVAIPLQSPADPPPPQDGEQLWLAACVVAFAGVAVGGVYIISRRCEPKYYWIMDKEQPPNFWVGTANTKECQINGWIRIGGPYRKAADAPPVHPDPTNRATISFNAPVTINVQSFSTGQWETIYRFTGDEEDFAYFPTNRVADMLRLEQIR